MTEKIAINNELVWTVAPISTIPSVSDEEIVNDLAEKNHWIISQGAGYGMISKKVQIGNYTFEPLILDDYTLKPEAKSRINSILKSGAQPQGWIIGKEIAKEYTIPQINWKEVMKPVMGVLVAIGIFMAVIMGTAIIVWLLAITLPLICVAVAIAALCLIDPKIIMVTSEGKWLEIYCDYSESS